MSFLGRLFEPAGAVEREATPPIVPRIEADIGGRPLMPRIALAMTAGGLVLIIALTISAGALSDNFGGADELSARTFKPWFRIALLASMGILLSGIITMLLAITVRIWWMMTANRVFFPVVVDARRRRAGRRPLFSESHGESGGGD